MRPTLIGLLIGVSWLCATVTARGQSPPNPEIIELKREIAQAKAMIAKWQADLADLEKRLAQAEALQRGTGPLRFSWDIERAMIGEGIQRSRQRLVEPMRGSQSFPGRETAPPGLPRR